MEPREPARGLLASLRVVAAAALALADTRLELASTEIEEERLRVAELLIWATLTLFLLAVGIVFAGLLVVLMLWYGPREMALAAMTGAFLVAGVLAAGIWRRKARSKPRFLHATLAELKGDRAALEGLREARP